MPQFSLVIGNKNYSSWSLRAWLMAKATAVRFDELVILLDQDDTRRRILEHSPAGKVPVLHADGLVVHESLAIGEYLAERFPAARLWPDDGAARATARAVSAEMHAGFADLRSALPMNCRGRFPGRPITPAVARDIDRIAGIWRTCRAAFGGDGGFLFGRFTIADAMFAPLASRFATYAVELDDVCAAYAETIRASPAMHQWLADAAAEDAVIADAEFIPKVGDIDPFHRLPRPSR